MNPFAHLNPQQQQAVLHEHGPILVLAGAGSGKTKVVTERIVHLIRQGTHPLHILGVTFTNKAALEMRERVHRACNSQVLITTFHSLGAKILREMNDFLGFAAPFHIYDQDDSEKLLKVCLAELNFSTVKAEVSAMKGLISKAKNEGRSPEQLDFKQLKSPTEKAFPAVYERYQKKLKEYGGVDFDDLLYLPLELFKNEPQVLDHYQNCWRYLLIDEYQDTNAAQYQLVQHLVKKSGNLFAVGDPDQSIYSWRGADINNILRFEQDHPDTRIVRLEENYRSTTIILEAANAVIEKNEKRMAKTLFSNLGQGELIQIHTAPSEAKEAHFVAKNIDQFRQQGIPLSDMAIFYRTNSQSRAFEDRLLEYSIPYRVIGGISFYQRKEIKDILAFLRVVENPADFIAFARTINLPKRGVGDASLEKLQAAANEKGMSILECCLRYLSGEPVAALRLAARQKTGLQEYLNIIYELKKKKSQLPLSELIQETIERSRYSEVLQEDPDSLDDRKQNLAELTSKAFEWQVAHPEGSLAQFLEELTLQTNVEEVEGIEKVNLMTLHNGKGLEFEVAFICGLEEELFPHANSRYSNDGLEEERRLFYVGITRAKRKLFLTSSNYRMFWGQYRPMRQSRFLQEIPKHLLEKVGHSSLSQGHERVFHSPSRDSSRFTPQQTFAEPSPLETQSKTAFNKGDIVFHPQFGIGKILALEEVSLGLTYRIFFQKDNTEKQLVAAMANLTRL